MTTTARAPSTSNPTSTSTSTSTSTAEAEAETKALAFLNTIPKCADILSQPDLRIIHPRNPDTFFHATLRSNNAILNSVFLYQPPQPRTSQDASDFNPQGQERDRERERGYLLLHLGTGVSGQPEIAHGGFLATVLDQVTGTLIKASGVDGGGGAVTAFLNVSYRKPVRVPGVVVARAEVLGVEGRKIYVRGVITRIGAGGEEGDGEEVCVSAEGMFLVKRGVTVRI